MNYVDSEMVREHINNEIDYLKEDMEISGYDKATLLDLQYLENLTENDIEEITQKVNDDEELQDKIVSLIEYWTHHR